VRQLGERQAPAGRRRLCYAPAEGLLQVGDDLLDAP
jgi:hypothetical protein